MRIDRGKVGALLGIAYWLVVLFTAVSAFGDDYKARFYATPKVSLGGPNGSIVKLMFIQENIDEKHYCLERVIEWPDGTVSKHQSDCVPFSEADPKDLEFESWSARARFGQGDWVLCIKLRRAEKTIQKVCTTFSVR